MTTLAPNVAAAFAIVDALAGAGVRHAVLSPGGHAVAQHSSNDWSAVTGMSIAKPRRLSRPSFGYG